MVISLTQHSKERIQERFDGDIYFQIKFKHALKCAKRWQAKENKGKVENTMVIVYDHIKYIYQKIGTKRKLITTFKNNEPESTRRATQGSSTSNNDHMSSHLYV